MRKKQQVFSRTPAWLGNSEGSPYLSVHLLKGKEIKDSYEYGGFVLGLCVCVVFVQFVCFFSSRSCMLQPN